MQNKNLKLLQAKQQGNGEGNTKAIIENFYFERFLKILHQYPRNYILSVVCLIIYYSQVISLCFGNAFLTEYGFQTKAITVEDRNSLFENNQKGTQQIDAVINLYNSDISVHYYFYKLLKYSRLYPMLYDIFGESSPTVKWVIIGLFLAVNVLLVMHPIIKLITYIITQTKFQQENISKEYLSPHQNRYENIEAISSILDLLSLFDSFTALLYGIYRYVFTIPSLLFSLRILVNSNSPLAEDILSVLNVVLTVIISIVTAVHDFDISYLRINVDQQERQDFLLRRVSIQSLINIVGDLVKCGVVALTMNVNQYLIVCIISFVLTLQEYAEFSLSFIYLRNNIARVNFAGLNILNLFNGIIILFGQVPSLTSDCSFILVMALALPVTAVFSHFIFEYLEKRIINWPIERASQNAATLDLYSRTVQSYFQNIDLKEYIYSKRGVYFESIALRHFTQCNDSSCFCKPMINQLNSDGNIEKKILRKKFIDAYLLEVFSRFISKSKSKQYNFVRFQYLALLIDSVRCPIKSNIEAIQLSNMYTHNLGFRERMILNLLCSRAYDLYEKNVITIEKQKQQSTGGNYYQTDNELYDIIRFDMLLSYFQKSTRIIYQLKREFYFLIAIEEVNLFDVKQKGEQILSLLDQIDDTIDELNKINPLSRRSQELTLIYTTIFDMRKKRIRQSITQKRKSIFHKIGRGDERTLNFFSSKSCCFFVSLLTPIGVIKRCTRTIFNVFGYGQSEIINRSIKTLIPDTISQVHDKILENFIKEGQTNHIMTNEYFFLGKSANNFIFPLQATMRVAHLNDEFGLSCFMERIDTSNQYILIDDKLTLSGRRNKIINMSRDLYTQCFSTVLNPERGDDRIGHIDLYKFIPFMQALDHQDCNELDYFQSVIIYPQNELHLQNMKKRIKITTKNASDLAWYLIFSLASNCGFLDVSFSVKRLKTKLGQSFKFIEIQNMRKVKRRLEKLESLNTLRSDLNQIMKLNVSIDDKTLQKSLGILSQTLKLTFSSNDFTMLFKKDTSSHSKLNKQDNVEESKWQLMKRKTIQSLSNRDTTNNKSSAGVEFEDALGDTNKDEDDTEKQNTHTLPLVTLSNQIGKRESRNENISVLNHENKKSFYGSVQDKSVFNTFNETYIDHEDASHVNLQKKTILDLSQISFNQGAMGERQRKKSISQNNLSNVFLNNDKQNKSELNASQLIYHIDTEQNDFEINQPIPIQSLTYRENDQLNKNGKNKLETNLNFNNKNEKVNNKQTEESFQKNLKNFDSFRVNHPSQNDSFGDQGRKQNIQLYPSQYGDVIDTAKERYEQSTARSQLPWGSATGRELRENPENYNDNEQLYQGATSRNKKDDIIFLDDDDYQEGPATKRDIKQHVLYEPSTERKPKHEQFDSDEQEDNVYANNNKRNNQQGEFVSNPNNPNKVTIKQLVQDKKNQSSSYLAFASNTKQKSLQSNQHTEKANKQQESSPLNRQRNESSQMLQSLSSQNQGQVLQGLTLKQVSSSEALSFTNLPPDGGSVKNNILFDFEGPQTSQAGGAQEVSRQEKSIKQQVFYSGTLSSLTTLKKSQKSQSSDHKIKVMKKKKKKLTKKLTSHKQEENDEKQIKPTNNYNDQNYQQKNHEGRDEENIKDHEENVLQHSRMEEEDINQSRILSNDNNDKDNQQNKEEDEQDLQTESEEEYEEEEEQDEGDEEDDEEEEENNEGGKQNNLQVQGSLSDNKLQSNQNQNANKKNHPTSFDSDGISEQKNKDMELVDRLDTGMDRSSSTRTRSDLSSKKRIIAVIMMKGFESTLVKTIKIIGCLSLLFLIMITIFVYFTITSNLSNMDDNQQVIYLGPGLEEDTSTVIIQNEFKIQYQNGLIVSKISDSKIADLNKGNDEEFQVIRERIQFISDTKLNFVKVVVDKSDLKTLDTFDSEGNIMYSVTSNQYYAMIQSFLGFIEYSHEISETSRLYVINNFIEIANIFDDLRESANSEAQSSADTTQTVLVYTFIMIIVVAFVTIGVIFPIYRKVQLSKEETLKLFATFPKEKLEQMILQMERVINSSIFKNATEKEIHLKSNIRWKKRTIANTTKLPKYNFFVAMGCIVAFLLISLYPIINYSINHNYIDQLKIMLQELSTIHKSRGHSIFCKSLLYMRISAANEDISQIATTIDTFYPTLMEKNAEILLELKSMLQNFQDSSRYDDSNQKTYVYNSLTSDMCNQFKLFKTLNLNYEKQREGYLDPDDCRNQFQNVLAHGMIIELEKIFQVYNDLFYIAQHSNFKSNFQFWDSSNNYNSLDDLQEFQSGGFESIFLFQQRDLQSLFSYLFNLQIILLIYAISIIILLFLIGWTKFVTYVHGEINRTKYLFSLFSIDSLLENNYIATYIKKSSKNK